MACPFTSLLVVLAQDSGGEREGATVGSRLKNSGTTKITNQFHEIFREKLILQNFSPN